MQEKGSFGVKEDSERAVRAVEQVGEGWTEGPEGRQRLRSLRLLPGFELLDF